MKHTQETKHRPMLLDLVNESFSKTISKVTNSQGLLESWSFGHKDADVITVMEDGRSEIQRFVEVQSRRDSVAKDYELQRALAKMKNTKPKVQGCLACEHGINVSIGRKNTFACR